VVAPRAVLGHLARHPAASRRALQPVLAGLGHVAEGVPGELAPEGPRADAERALGALVVPRAGDPAVAHDAGPVLAASWISLGLAGDARDDVRAAAGVDLVRLAAPCCKQQDDDGPDLEEAGHGRISWMVMVDGPGSGDNRRLGVRARDVGSPVQASPHPRHLPERLLPEEPRRTPVTLGSGMRHADEQDRLLPSAEVDRDEVRVVEAGLAARLVVLDREVLGGEPRRRVQRPPDDVPNLRAQHDDQVGRHGVRGVEPRHGTLIRCGR